VTKDLFAIIVIILSMFPPVKHRVELLSNNWQSSSHRIEMIHLAFEISQISSLAYDPSTKKTNRKLIATRYFFLESFSLLVHQDEGKKRRLVKRYSLRISCSRARIVRSDIHGGSSRMVHSVYSTKFTHRIAAVTTLPGVATRVFSGEWILPYLSICLEMIFKVLAKFHRGRIYMHSRTHVHRTRQVRRW